MSIGIDTCCVLLLNVDLAAAEQSQDSRFLRRGQRRCTFPPLTGVPQQQSSCMNLRSPTARPKLSFS